jgi:acyl-CoA synthetase (AMP-forming)/AMP-acid ligase II/acyl carrier protein
VPTIHQAVIAQAAQYRQKAPNHRFRFVRSSSAALPRSVYSALQAVFEAPVVEAYGMTEASHQMASNPVSAGAQKPGSVGVPAGVEIVIVDGTGKRVPAGGTGEIIIRGSGVFDGYENNPDADAHAFVDGWFRTGDLGHFDSDGYLYVSGRISEVINRGGEKIAPCEIEEALLDHPDVAQAVAFARAHPTLGQDVAAAVVLRPESISRESALRGFLFNRIADFKIPSTIVVVDDIPKGPTGKIARTSLEQELGHLIVKSSASPRSAVERLVEAAFREVLGCAPVGPEDNFFALGGDSLKGAQVMARVNTQCGTDLSPATLFRCPSVAALAAAIEAAEDAADVFERDLADEIAQMSDEEVARLLADEGSPAQ